MEETKKIVECPKCGNEMNHHADKIITEVSKEDLEYYDDALEGILEQHYKCPGCGSDISIHKKQKEL